MSRDILLSEIVTNPGQPRRQFDAAALGELAQSMQASGLAVPILVRPVDGRFEIVHGERRYRAALSLGWQSIACDVRELTAGDAALLALVENVQRAELLPLEEARAYAAILAGGDMTQAKLGARLGKSQSYIAGKLRLLKLPGPVAFFLERGAISEGHAKQLLRLESGYSGVRHIGRPGDFWAEYWPGVDWRLPETWQNEPDRIGMLALSAVTFPATGFGGFADFMSGDAGILPAACASMAAELERSGGDVPAWSAAAWWLAAWAAMYGESVAELRGMVDYCVSAGRA